MEITTTEHFAPILEQIVQNVFQTMLGEEVLVVDEPWPPKSEVLTAAISLTGPWKGAVLVECPLREAFLITSRLVAIPPPTSVNDDVRDAIGELANMVGGNLKSVLPGGVELSLPSIVTGTDYRVAICRAATVRRWVFTSGEMTFGVVVVEVIA